MSASLGLFRLQQIDSQIDRVKARLNVIQRTLDNDKKVKDALTQFEQADSNNNQAMRQVKNAEAEANDLKIKIEQTESNLYSGNVRSPKELQDLQLEASSLKKHLAILEERELEAMLSAESAEAEKEKAERELNYVQEQTGNESKTLLEEKKQLASQMESLAQERQAARSPLDSALLEIYEDLRKQKRGVAVAETDDNACAACGTNLTAALQQNARSQNKLAYCPSCGRILFAN